MTTILAPIDFSPISDAVLEKAGALARAHHGRVILLNVIRPSALVVEYGIRPEDVLEINASAERNATRELESRVKKLKENFITVETMQVSGYPPHQIVAATESCGADYIVLGSHGHTAFYDLVVGSTTHGVLSRAKCPVVVVPAPRPAVKR